jgi:murein L,D-transpeptidase YafK
MRQKASKTIAILFAGTVLAACNGSVLGSSIPKHEKPVPQYLTKAMKTKGMTLASPIMLRVFKEENVMEVWKKNHKNKYALLQSYEICKWSGKLGPKYKEGDRQAPEGFYHVNKGLMNPNSDFHLSFNLGFPNVYDRANGRTGSYLMVHGDCSSAGCYSMTDEYIEEIYALAREAFRGGQKAFQVQAFPFKMTAENMAKKVNHPKFEFWKMLKEGSDHFEITNRQPKVDVCEKRYVFNRIADENGKFNARAECPPSKMPRSLALAFNQKQNKDQAVFDKILKRNATSPFAKPSEIPASTDMSIKAKPTVGALAILEPVKPVVVVSQPQQAAVPQEPVNVVPQQKPVTVQEVPAQIVTPNAEPVVNNPVSEQAQPVSGQIETQQSTQQVVVVPQQASRPVQ